jgi:hypothetical protein
VSGSLTISLSRNPATPSGFVAIIGASELAPEMPLFVQDHIEVNEGEPRDRYSRTGHDPKNSDSPRRNSRTPTYIGFRT